jgi:hypothetical protein
MHIIAERFVFMRVRYVLIRGSQDLSNGIDVTCYRQLFFLFCFHIYSLWFQFWKAIISSNSQKGENDHLHIYKQ